MDKSLVDKSHEPTELLASAGYYFVVNPLVLDAANQVVPTAESLVTQYEPFTYYRSPIPYEDVEYVLGTKKARVLGQEGQDFNLHTLFASLSPEEPDELLRFMNLFGALYHKEDANPPSTPAGRTISQTIKDTTGRILNVAIFQPSGWYRGRSKSMPLIMLPVPMSEYLAELRLFRWVSELVDLYTSESAYALAEHIDSGRVMVENNQGPLWEALRAIAPPPSWTGDPFIETEEWLERIFSRQLQGVSPMLKFTPALSLLDRIGQATRKQPFANRLRAEVAWEFDSLISAIYLMLLLAMAHHRFLRKCKHDKCGRFFETARKDQRYCTPECQQRAKQLRYIRRVRASRGREPQNNIVAVRLQ